MGDPGKVSVLLVQPGRGCSRCANVLCGEGGVVHEEEVDVSDWDSLAACTRTDTAVCRTVGDEESLVAGGHEVAGLPV